MDERSTIVGTPRVGTVGGSSQQFTARVPAPFARKVAYAEALDLGEAIVCAPDVEPRFCGDRIGAQVMKADQVVAYLQGPRADVVSINTSR
jgi:hypothetical protein